MVYSIPKGQWGMMKNQHPRHHLFESAIRAGEFSDELCRRETFSHCSRQTNALPTNQGFAVPVTQRISTSSSISTWIAHLFAAYPRCCYFHHRSKSRNNALRHRHLLAASGSREMIMKASAKHQRRMMSPVHETGLNTWVAGRNCRRWRLSGLSRRLQIQSDKVVTLEHHPIEGHHIGKPPRKKKAIQSSNLNVTQEHVSSLIILDQ